MSCSDGGLSWNMIVASVIAVVIILTGIAILTSQNNSYTDGLANAQLQYFLQVNESWPNGEKYQLIQEICNASYPLELKDAIIISPRCTEQNWKCNCKKKLLNLTWV